MIGEFIYTPVLMNYRKHLKHEDMVDEEKQEGTSDRRVQRV
jgi:hypothetical protein